jgi:hypothetical protein
MRRLCLALACACGSPTAEPPAQPPEIRGVVAVVREDAAAGHIDTPSDAEVAPKRFEPYRLWSGRHGSRIASVQLSADGTAAVTIDDRDHARLWPALDGTREPLVLPIAAPSQVEILRDGQGFAVAALDGVGGLSVLEIDGDDLLRAETKLGNEPPYASVTATSAGFIAVRSDHHLDLIDRTGTPHARLVPGPGERIARLLHAADRTLALVETREGVHGRWVEATASTLAWGDRTPVLDLDARTVSISPDAKRLAGMRGKRRVPVHVELADGTLRPIAVALGGVMPEGRPLGFATNDTVVFDAMDNASMFFWYELATRRATQLSDELLFNFDSQSTTVRGGKVASSLDRELVIVTRNRLSYLGHRRESARQLRTSPAGPIANVGGTALLDDRFRIDRRLPADAVLVDRDLALVQIAVDEPLIDETWLEIEQPRKRRVTRVALYDLAKKREVQSWSVARTERRVRYEPATRMMAIDHGRRLEVATFDPAARKFGASTAIALPATMTNLALLDPALAGGDVALTLHGLAVRRWRPEHLETGTVPDADAQLAAAPEAIDRAGRLYLRETPSTVVVHAGQAEHRLDELNGWSVRPSPDAEHVAAFAKNRVMLLDAAGALVWSTGLVDVRDLAWTHDGKLIASAGDLVELSVSDGHIVYAQCGWSFGVRSTYRDDFFDSRPTGCDR